HEILVVKEAEKRGGEQTGCDPPCEERKEPSEEQRRENCSQPPKSNRELCHRLRRNPLALSEIIWHDNNSVLKEVKKCHKAAVKREGIKMHLSQSQPREGEEGSNERAENCQYQLKGQLGYGAPVERRREQELFTMGSTNHHFYNLIQTQSPVHTGTHTASFLTKQGHSDRPVIILPGTIIPSFLLFFSKANQSGYMTKANTRRLQTTLMFISPLESATQKYSSVMRYTTVAATVKSTSHWNSGKCWRVSTSCGVCSASVILIKELDLQVMSLKFKLKASVS
ncbi:hypothetical protein DNTS_006427, partial [Danionella cerebrum]